MRIRVTTLLLSCVLVTGGCGDADNASPAEESTTTSTTEVGQESPDTSPITASESVAKGQYLKQIGDACTEARLRAELAQRKAQGETDSQVVKYMEQLSAVFTTEVARIREVAAPPELVDEVEAYVMAEDAVIETVSKLADNFSANSVPDGPEIEGLLAAWTKHQGEAARAQRELGLKCPDLSQASG